MSVMSHRLPRRGNLVGFIALVLVFLGAIAVAASFFLPTAVHLNGVSIVLYVAGAFVLAAFVLAIIGLTRWGEPKATSVIALVLSVLVAGTCLVNPNLLTQRNEVGFLSTVRANVQTDVSDAKLVALGSTVCDKLRAGAGGEDFIGLFLFSGMEPKDLGVVAGAAVRHLCPDQADTAQKLATLYAPSTGE